MIQPVKYLEDTDQLSISFDTLIGRLEQDKVLYSIGSLPAERENLYRDLFTGTLMDAVNASNKVFTTQIMTNLVVDFFKHLNQDPTAKPSKMALHLSNRKVLVWAIIPDDKEEIVDGLYRIEAKINFEYRQSGFSLSVTVVDESDGLNIPSQYKELTI